MTYNHQTIQHLSLTMPPNPHTCNMPRRHHISSLAPQKWPFPILFPFFKSNKKTKDAKTDSTLKAASVKTHSRSPAVSPRLRCASRTVSGEWSSGASECPTLCSKSSTMRSHGPSVHEDMVGLHDRKFPGNKGFKSLMRDKLVLKNGLVNPSLEIPSSRSKSQLNLMVEVPSPIGEESEKKGNDPKENLGEGCLQSLVISPLMEITLGGDVRESNEPVDRPFAIKGFYHSLPLRLKHSGDDLISPRNHGASDHRISSIVSSSSLDTQHQHSAFSQCSTLYTSADYINVVELNRISQDAASMTQAVGMSHVECQDRAFQNHRMLSQEVLTQNPHLENNTSLTEGHGPITPHNAAYGSSLKNLEARSANIDNISTALERYVISHTLHWQPSFDSQPEVLDILKADPQVRETVTKRAASTDGGRHDSISKRQNQGDEPNRRPSDNDSRKSPVDWLPDDSFDNRDPDGDDAPSDPIDDEDTDGMGYKYYICPFYIYDSRKYATCLEHRHDGFSRIKQHISRVHTNCCLDCKESFSTLKELKNHQKRQTCTKAYGHVNGFIDGKKGCIYHIISQRQPKAPIRVKYNHIYRVLFQQDVPENVLLNLPYPFVYEPLCIALRNRLADTVCDLVAEFKRLQREDYTTLTTVQSLIEMLSQKLLLNAEGRLDLATLIKQAVLDGLVGSPNVLANNSVQTSRSNSLHSNVSPRIHLEPGTPNTDYQNLTPSGSLRRKEKQASFMARQSSVDGHPRSQSQITATLAVPQIQTYSRSAPASPQEQVMNYNTLFMPSQAQNLNTTAAAVGFCNNWPSLSSTQVPPLIPPFITLNDGQHRLDTETNPSLDFMPNQTGTSPSHEKLLTQAQFDDIFDSTYPMQSIQ